MATTAAGSGAGICACGAARTVAVLAGDGIGPEVTAQAVRVLQLAAGLAGVRLTLSPGLIGGQAIDACGEPLPAATLDLCLGADACLLGAVGGPAWDGLAPARRPEAGLLALRKGMGLYANIRPVACHPALAASSPLRPDLVAGADLVVYRELGGGIYYGQPRFTETLPDGGGERAVDTMVYTTPEIERLARLGFAAARSRRGRLTSVDKANVLDCSRLWRRTVQQVAAEYPDVHVDHAYVDSCAMAIVAAPRGFDVLVTGNMFGDILSDLAACIAGSLGMLPSASLGERGGLYEPVHGSAPGIAGQDRANPLGAILSAAMLLDLSLGLHQAAQAVRGAVSRALEDGYRTADISSGRAGERLVGTAEMGEAVAERIPAAWNEMGRNQR
ncbi:MAG: 3-isopropylmalate dehydrogenase [Bacillota bacterium]|nr:3-isopropylmalate dehydrogenase [Bacillota bacterium]